MKIELKKYLTDDLLVLTSRISSQYWGLSISFVRASSLVPVSMHYFVLEMQLYMNGCKYKIAWKLCINVAGRIFDKNPK